jgi:hypothetical protein
LAGIMQWTSIFSSPNLPKQSLPSSKQTAETPWFPNTHLYIRLRCPESKHYFPLNPEPQDICVSCEKAESLEAPRPIIMFRSSERLIQRRAGRFRIHDVQEGSRRSICEIISLGLVHISSAERLDITPSRRISCSIQKFHIFRP